MSAPPISGCVPPAPATAGIPVTGGLNSAAFGFNRPRLTSPIRQDLEAARQDVLTGIANTDAGRQVLTELIKSDTFAPVGKPTVLARIYRGPDGLFLGHAKGIDGKIVGNTRWVKISSVGSRLLTSAGMITGHLMLVEISNFSRAL